MGRNRRRLLINRHINIIFNLISSDIGTGLSLFQRDLISLIKIIVNEKWKFFSQMKKENGVTKNSTIERNAAGDLAANFQFATH